MTVFKGGEAIKEFLEEFDSWLSESVTVYLLGGSAMTVRGLKDQTEDIDLAVGVVSEFEHVYQTLTSQGFTVVDEPTESFEGVGKTVELHHDKRGFRNRYLRTANRRESLDHRPDARPGRRVLDREFRNSVHPLG